MSKKKKQKVQFKKTSSGKIVLHINPNELTVRNELHFEVQKNTKAQVYKDKTKYNRKKKHKNKYED